MMYIKKFNENFESNSKDVIYYCNNILVELKDAGYNIKINHDRGINDSDILCITISGNGLIDSKEIIDYVKTINDFLSIDYKYDFNAYAAGFEYDDLKSFDESGIKSNRFIIYYEFKDN